MASNHQPCARRTSSRQTEALVFLALVLFLGTTSAFVVAPSLPWTTARTSTASFFSAPRLPRPSSYSSSSSSSKQPRHYHQTTRLYSLPDVDSMKAGDMRKELESYGISTKSFFEKSEFATALKKARTQGKQPKKTASTTSTAEPNGAKANGKSSSSTSSSSSGSSSSSSGSGSSKSKASRAEQLEQEMTKAKAMKVGDLKKELQARGVSTKSFFEKTEFVKAYAQAVVDGVTTKKGAGSAAAQEDFDPSYRDVSMMKMDARDPRMLQGTVIDVTAKR